MKKLILALTTAAIAGAGVQTASAGGYRSGCGWSTAGQVLAGVTAGVVIGSALAPRPAYYVAPAPVAYPAPGYGYVYTYAAPPAPVVYTPPPRVVYTVPAPVVYAAPAPVVVYRRPVYVARPAVSVGFGWSSGCRGYSVRVGGCW
jgi:hypothetical protein